LRRPDRFDLNLVQDIYIAYIADMRIGTLEELELVCDAIAVVTLRQLGMDPSNVIDAIEKVTQFNRQRFGAATKKNYPTIAQRRAFARQVQHWRAPILRCEGIER
jgi:hypothetical protein